MGDETSKQYKYRLWPLLLPSYFIFSMFYFIFVYSWSEFSYQTLAGTLVVAICTVTAPVIAYFYLKIVKTTEYRTLGLGLLYSYLISNLIVFILMLTYLEGWAWFGAIAVFFVLFCYNLLWLIFSYIFFRSKKINCVVK